MPALILSNTTPTSINYDGAVPDLRTVLGFILFFAVLVGAYFLFRGFSRRTLGGSGNIRVLERFVIGRDSYLMLLQVGSRILVIGSGKEGMSLICELEPGDLETTPHGTGTDGASTFGQRFLHNMKLQAGLMPKGTPPKTPSDTAYADSTVPAVPRVVPPPEPEVPERSAQAAEHDAAEPTPEQAAASFAAVMRRVQNAVPEPPAAPKLQSNPNLSPENGRQAARALASGQVGLEGDGMSGAVNEPSRDYDSAIRALQQLGQIDETKRVTPVAPRAAAATYAAAGRGSPPHRENADTPDDVREQRAQQPAAEEPAETPEIPPLPEIPAPPEIPVSPEKPQQPSARRNAAQKLASRGGRGEDAAMDELFDKIQQRSSRYSRHGKKKDNQQ